MFLAKSKTGMLSHLKYIGWWVIRSYFSADSTRLRVISGQLLISFERDGRAITRFLCSKQRAWGEWKICDYCNAAARQALASFVAAAAFGARVQLKIIRSCCRVLFLSRSQVIKDELKIVSGLPYKRSLDYKEIFNFLRNLQSPRMKHL